MNRSETKKARERRLYAAARGAGWTSETQCALGVSLSNPRCEGEHLAACIEWAGSRFERCTLLIGDSLHRLTLQAEEGLSPDAARAEASRRGQRLIEEVAARLPFGPCSFSILPTSELERHAKFQERLLQLERLFATDTSFGRSVRGDVAEYMSRSARDRARGARSVIRAPGALDREAVPRA